MGRRKRRTSRGGGWGSYRPYVPVDRRRKQVAQEARRAAADGSRLDPVHLDSRTIATTAWGRAWCDHIESFRDYANRLERGRTYVRNGSVYHLVIGAGEIRAQVMGSRPYHQHITIAPCKPDVWKRVRQRCAGGIGSLIELLEGRISSEVMAAMTAERDGLLPDLLHVELACTCPDWAQLCKHLAAVLYGVGARLDARPELLFTLRGVDPSDLVETTTLPGQATKPRAKRPAIKGSLSSVFGIELDAEADTKASPPPNPKAAPAKKKTTPRPARKVTRQELLEAGVPPGTITTWLRQGVLEAGDQRGVYRHTPESRTRIQRYSE